jgi:hypothetical protein
MMFCRISAIALGVLVFAAPALHAQELEPRAYSHTPVGLNFALLGYGYTEGDVLLDVSSPLQGASLSSQGLVLAWARSLDLWGDSGKFDAVLPYGWASGEATFQGERRHRDVDGFGDPTVRLTWNFIGAPALTMSQFPTRRAGWIVGASLRVALPLGQYDADRLLNIGTNRWSFKPEVGISRPWKRWTFEVATGVTFYTDNEDYMGAKRAQDPLLAVQAHAIYNFGSAIWAGLDGTYYEGGRTTLNGTVSDDRQSSSRVGLTVALPVSPHHSFKLYGSTGATARVGGDFNTAGIVWQYRWGGTAPIK